MKVSGFSFIRNAVRYDYPIVEAIRSILPICDEFVLALGNSDDNTQELIEAIGSDKIRVVPTVWDDSLREGGRVLAVETDKALAAVTPDSDWAFYIQGDEVVHENDLPTIHRAMETYLDQPEVEGLLFNYLHFYGSYRYVGDSRRWYRHEIRVVRNTGNVASYRDAQGFRTRNNRKLRVKPVDATIFHYGWVKPPEKQREKLSHVWQFWNADAQRERVNKEADEFDYANIDSLALFADTHPAVMRDRLARMDWDFEFDVRQKKLSPRYRVLAFIEKLTGWRVGEYRNYRVIR